MPRLYLFLALTLTLAVAQFRRAESGARLEIIANYPLRVYLTKSNTPFRLHPVDAILPLKVDLFYRDTLWRRNTAPQTLEVTHGGDSHFFLLNGKGSFDLPPGDYQLEAYRGLFFTPVSMAFQLKPGETKRLPITMQRWTEDSKNWLSGDDHIHLPRTVAENEIFLQWLQAEDLNVANFLQLQRQIDAAPQYAFGVAGEARKSAYSIRSGQESRAEPYGHINLLGGNRLIRPLSVGSMYANEPAAAPWPSQIFQQGKQAGALTGFAHFHGSMPHSTLLMDLALGNLDFIEVFQFGKLWREEWYELIDAGFRFQGIAGSDFPVPLNRATPWPKHIPILGPERTLVKATAGPSAYDAWARGIRNGAVTVSNGPLIEIRQVGDEVHATAGFHQPLEKLDLIHNGKVIASVTNNRALQVSAHAKPGWYAAHATGQQAQAHTNPIDVGPVKPNHGIRARLAERWQAELNYYRSANLPFANDAERQQFFAEGERASAVLRSR